MGFFSPQNQKGQAATEFLIAAACVLVPLFLIVPLLGKYIDIKHAAIQNARFSAWEYTVWTGDHEQVMAGLNDNQSGGVKKYKTTTEQGWNYFFTDRPAADYGTASASSAPDPLWRDHRQTPLLAETDVAHEIKEHDTPVPAGVVGEIAQTLFQFVGDVVSFFGKMLRFVGADADFDVINTKGHFTSDVKVTVNSLDQILPHYAVAAHNGEKTKPLIFKAKAAVQTNNWNAGSRTQAEAESRGLVVTSLLRPITKPLNKFVKALDDLAGDIPGLMIKVPGLPDFGRVEDDLVPYEYLEGNKKKLKDKAGLYSYE